MQRPHQCRRGCGFVLQDLLVTESYRKHIGQYLASDRLGEIVLIALDRPMLANTYNYRQWLIVAHLEWRSQLLVQRSNQLD